QPSTIACNCGNNCDNRRRFSSMPQSRSIDSSDPRWYDARITTLAAQDLTLDTIVAIMREWKTEPRETARHRLSATSRRTRRLRGPAFAEVRRPPGRERTRGSRGLWRAPHRTRVRGRWRRSSGSIAQHPGPGAPALQLKLFDKDHG